MLQRALPFFTDFKNWDSLAILKMSCLEKCFFYEPGNNVRLIHDNFVVLYRDESSPINTNLNSK